MLMTNQFLELFREETYAVTLKLMDKEEIPNPFENILASEPIDGIYTKEYSVVPMGALGGRKEAEPIPQKNMTMGYTCYGSQAIEASGKVNISKRLQQRAREFSSPDGVVDEPKFAGHLADSVGRGFIQRQKQKWHQLEAKIFNVGGIAAGEVFFNMRERADGLSDIPNTNLIYDGRPLFALPGNEHRSYAAQATSGPGSRAVGTAVDMAGAILDTGGYFNAFQLPPAYWALKRVVIHWYYNMQFDENDERCADSPDTLLVSSYNIMKWLEILESKFIEPVAAGNTTNIENVFQIEQFKMRLVHSPYLIANTWYVGKSNGGGIKILNPSQEEDPWAYYKDEDNRSYFISYEKEWGFLVRNWRNWCAGAISTDGTTPPNFNGVAENQWYIEPAGV